MASTPFRRLCHWGPLTVLGIIKLITWATVHLMGMWWPPQSSVWAGLHGGMFLLLAGLTLYYFMQSLLEGPGFVPLGWKPDKEKDTEYLQFCVECNGYKAPRSHHCRRCGHCVKKLDHHCPWINTCVGHNNHGYFTMFLIFAVLGCLQAFIVLTISMYHALNRVWYTYNGTGREPVVYVTMGTLPLMLLATGMALGVVLAVGTLLYLQVKGLLRNQTTIEEWIVEKAAARRVERGLPPFVFPYDRGAARNLRAALAPRGDGLSWPVRDGAGEYDLTLEQIAQKIDKRLRSRLYTAVAAYSGRWWPVCGYPRAAVSYPWSSEPRLPLRPGDVLRVTRQRKHWLFGEMQAPGAGEGWRGERGWAPRDALAYTHAHAHAHARKHKPD